MKPISILAILFLLIVVSHANTNSDDDNQDESSSSNGHNNPLIRLPTTQTSDLDLTELLNRHRVNLRNRYRVPLTRYVPRRCRHQFTTFGLGVPVDPRDDLATIMKKQGEVIRHRHVAGKFDPTVELKQDAVVYEVKEEYDGEWKAGRPHHRHHDDDEGYKVHDEVHAHRFNHHGHKKMKKKKGNYIMRKIRKFLSHF